MSFTGKAFQSIFFPNKQGAPKQAWLDEFSTMGNFESGIIRRANKNISYLTLKCEKSCNDKLVVFTHPISRRGKYWFANDIRVRMYLDWGYALVFFDFNGFGESDRIDPCYWKDVACTIEHFCSAKELSHTILHGVSFGSFHMIRAIPKLPKNAVVILENTTRSFMEYWQRWFITRNLGRAFDMFGPQWYKDMDIVQALQQLDRPDLKFICIACEKDEFSPAKEMADLVSNIRSPKEFLLFEGAEHLQAPIVDFPRYQKAIQKIVV